MNSKMMVSFLVALVLISTSMFTTPSQASSLENHKGEMVEKLLQKVTQRLQKEYPNAKAERISLEDYQKLKQEMRAQNKHEDEQDNKAVILGPAPPVTDVAILEVESENGYEYVYGKFYSSPVKGLTAIGTYEEGYGNDFQWLGSEHITLSHPDYYYVTLNIDLDGDTIIDAFYHIVEFDSDVKIQSGQFALYKFQSTSYNYPWNTLSDQINIVHE